MSDPDCVDGGASPESGDPGDELERLRRLLLAREQEQIRDLIARLDDAELRAREVGGILPGAIRHASRQGPALERALAPTLESATRRAIQSDAKSFADALFPIMGPAIRKAIAESLRGLVQAMNQALEHSLSMRGLRWRLEALRSGRSFGEVVLSHTLVFRVEQIFLIHREAGLLLQHVVATEVEAQDADMVSGMLTAIQDFVRDSFGMDHNETLQTMEVGDLQVWVEQGPRASLAAAVRGTAPVELRQTLREALEVIHRDHTEALASFAGDAAPFERTRPLLEECLQSRRAEAATGTSLVFKTVVGLGAAVVVWWLASGWLFQRRLDRFLAAVGAEPGVVVTSVERQHQRATVYGLRDPLAVAVDDALAAAGLASDAVRLRFQPYQALAEPFVLTRARLALEPPVEITLTLADGVLVARGAADDRWRARARDLARVLPGVVAFDDDEVVAVAGSVALRRRLENLASAVERHVVSFALASAEVDADNRARLAPVVTAARDLVTAAEEGFVVARILVEGSADASGGAELNTRLSRDRAEAVTAVLVEGGVPARFVQAIGRGTLTLGADGAEPAQRRVGFTVELAGGDQRGGR